jgi:hypothetical protein
MERETIPSRIAHSAPVRSHSTAWGDTRSPPVVATIDGFDDEVYAVR